MPPVQVACAHSLPCAASRQAGCLVEPLQPVPLGPHNAEGLALHSLSGSAPRLTGAQMPDG
jgi:hypothetical protein